MRVGPFVLMALLGNSVDLPEKSPNGTGGLRLTAATISPSFRSSQDVSLRVILSNEGPERRPVLIDREFSWRASPRLVHLRPARVVCARRRLQIVSRTGGDSRGL